MKILLTIAPLLLASTMNHISFGMEEKDAGCCGWLIKKTTYTDPEEVPLEKIKKKHYLTPIQKYYDLTISSTEELKNNLSWGKMADLVEIIYHAKNRHNITANELGKFIFNTNQQDTDHILASLIVARIGKYHETIEATQTPYLTRIELKLNNVRNSVDNKPFPKKIKVIQAKCALHTFNVNNAIYETTPEEQNAILAFDLNNLVIGPIDRSLMAKILYKDDESTENQESETK